MSGYNGFASREEWLEARKRVVGASEVAALFGCQPAWAMSRFALWHVKRGDAEAPEADSPRVAWGVRLESTIAECAAEKEGWKIHHGRHVVDAEEPGLGATLDYVIDECSGPFEDAPPASLEIKNVDIIVHKRQWTLDDAPPHILLQLQTQLAVTGYQWGAIAALVGGHDLAVYRYPARPKIISEIRTRVHEFWKSIREGREPPIDGSDSASAVLRDMHGELDGETIDLSASNEWPEAAAAFIAAREAKSSAEAAFSEARNRVERLLAGHARGEGSGYRARVSVSAARPDRKAFPGEIIHGRAESRRLSVKEVVL